MLRFTPLAAQKDVLPLVEEPGQPLLVDADPVRLEQMIGNVLSNAITFTPENGSIFVAAAIEDD